MNKELNMQEQDECQEINYREEGFVTSIEEFDKVLESLEKLECWEGN